MINRIFIVLLTALFSLQLSAQCPQKRSCNQKPCKERCNIILHFLPLRLI